MGKWAACNQLDRQSSWPDPEAKLDLPSIKSEIPFFSSDTCIEIMREHCHSTFWNLIDQWDSLSLGDVKPCHVEGGVKERLITRLLIPFLNSAWHFGRSLEWVSSSEISPERSQFQLITSGRPISHPTCIVPWVRHYCHPSVTQTSAGAGVNLSTPWSRSR